MLSDRKVIILESRRLIFNVLKAMWSKHWYYLIHCVFFAWEFCVVYYSVCVLYKIVVVVFCFFFFISFQYYNFSVNGVYMEWNNANGSFRSLLYRSRLLPFHLAMEMERELASWELTVVQSSHTRWIKVFQTSYRIQEKKKFNKSVLEF